MSFNAGQTILLAVLVLFAGRGLNRLFPFLRRQSIPEPVSGGLLAALVAVVLHALGISISFDMALRNALLLSFFTCIGLTANFRDLLQGGRSLVVLTLLSTVMLFVQNAAGLGIAGLFGLPAPVGLLGGSISLTGGIGTSVAWGEVFNQRFGMEAATEIGVACATFGLVAGGLLGGPLAAWLIRRHRLQADTVAAPVAVSAGSPADLPDQTRPDAFFAALLLISAAVGAGMWLHRLMLQAGGRLPEFVSCLFAGILINNLVQLHPRGRALLLRYQPSVQFSFEVSLSLFLGISLMGLQLWKLVALAAPVLVMMVVQVALVAGFVVWVLFRVYGKTYDAAVTGAGFIGYMLGAMPTSLALMKTITEKHGPSPAALLIVPLIGAFFIDIINAVCIQLFVGWLAG